MYSLLKQCAWFTLSTRVVRDFDVCALSAKSVYMFSGGKVCSGQWGAGLVGFVGALFGRFSYGTGHDPDNLTTGFELVCFSSNYNYCTILHHRRRE